MTELQLMRVIGRNLKDVLDDALMTQKELSDETGISEPTISRYIRGESMPSLKNIMNIAYVMECDLNELIPYDEKVI